jgi:hypothetical protein
MFRALVLKELRETGWIALVGLGVHLTVVASRTGHDVFPIWGRADARQIPFLDNDGFVQFFCIVSVALAIALGLRQTLGESIGGTWLFLLHRPAGRRRVLAAKLAVGAGLYLLCGAAAILTYAAWAATPGTHASPFYWWMTGEAWMAWAVISLVYLAAFLSGIRPARWFGTRLLPLAAAAAMVMVTVSPFLLGWPLLGAAAILLIAASLIDLIHFIARTRDFS